MPHPPVSGREAKDLSAGFARRLTQLMDGVDPPVSNAELAAEMGINRGNVSHWKNRPMIPIGIYLAKLPAAFRRLRGKTPNLQWLLTETGSPWVQLAGESASEAWQRGVMEAAGEIEDVLVRLRRRTRTEPILDAAARASQRAVEATTQAPKLLEVPDQPGAGRTSKAPAPRPRKPPTRRPGPRAGNG